MAKTRLVTDIRTNGRTDGAILISLSKFPQRHTKLTHGSPNILTLIHKDEIHKRDPRIFSYSYL